MPKQKIEQQEADDEFDEDYEDEEEADEDLEEIETPKQEPIKQRFKPLPTSNAPIKKQIQVKPSNETTQENKPILIPRCVSQEEMFNIINDKLDYIINKLGEM